MPKILLIRNQIVNHIYYKAGEQDVPDAVAAVLQKRGALVELPAAPHPPVAMPPQKLDINEVIKND